MGFMKTAVSKLQVKLITEASSDGVKLSVSERKQWLYVSDWKPRTFGAKGTIGTKPSR